MDVFSTLKEELNMVTLGLPLREGQKEGKNKMEVSGGCSNDELQQCCQEGVGMTGNRKKR